LLVFAHLLAGITKTALHKSRKKAEQHVDEVKIAPGQTQLSIFLNRFMNS
jgi:hypothetical protein